MKRVHMHIDRLVLRGFRHEDRHDIADGLQQELGRMLADRQAAQQITTAGDMSRLRVGSIQIGHDVKPQSIGTQVARGIGKGIRK